MWLNFSFYFRHEYFTTIIEHLIIQSVDFNSITSRNYIYIYIYNTLYMYYNSICYILFIWKYLTWERCSNLVCEGKGDVENDGIEFPWGVSRIVSIIPRDMLRGSPLDRILKLFDIKIWRIYFAIRQKSQSRYIW